MIKTKREATALFSWAIALLRSPSDSNEIYTRAPGSISGTEDSLVNEHTSVLATSGTFVAYVLNVFIIARKMSMT